MSASSTDSKSAAKDLTLSFRVPVAPATAYAAINRVSEWWIGQVEGTADAVGAVFTYAFEPYHRTAQEVTELIPDKKVEWTVVESSINFVEDKEEWKDTRIVFELVHEGSETEVRFTHRGLTPKIECYKNCSAGWEFYILESLPSLITTGKGIAPPF